jgi:maleate isomerase
MSAAPYRLTPDTGTAATIGLIVLQVDETLEGEFRRLLPAPELALHVSRIPSGADLTPQTIARMAEDLPAAAALLPPAAQFDAVAYACTSGTSLIGPDRVERLVRSACRTRAVTTPLQAAVAALHHLGTRRIGLVSPYAPPVASGVRDALERQGIAIAHAVHFGERVEANVARIDPASIFEHSIEVARQQADIEAIFLSCTNMRTLDILAPLEAKLGLPVLSSNLALAWHLARLARRPDLLHSPVSANFNSRISLIS